MTEGVYFVKTDEKIQLWNKGAENLTGFSSDEIVGKSFTLMPVRFEDNRGEALQRYENPVTRCLQEKKPISKNFFIITKDNRKVPVEENAMPYFEKGTIAGVVATFRDITSCMKIAESHIQSIKKERLIPICGWCKKIKNDENYWEQLEVYLTNEGFGVFTHGMCPACADKIFEKKVYLESYQDICKSISASISLDEVLQLVVTNVVKVMNVKASSLRLLNKEKQQLELVALAGKSVSVYDITEHKDSKYYKEALQEGIRSILSIPMRFEKEIIGVLRMYTTEPVKYTDEDLQFISAIAEQGAIAIINARIFEKAVSREKEYLRVFEEITKAVSSTLNVKEVLALIVRKIPEVMGLKASSLALAGKSVSVYDITEHKDSKYYKEALQEGIRSILSIPMRYQNKVIGVLRLYTTKPIKHSDEDLKFISAIAEQTAIAIVNAKRFEKEITKEKEYLMVFEEITKAISSTLSASEVLDMIVQKIPEVMGLKAATIRLLDKTGEKLKLVASHGLSKKYLERGPVDTEENIIEALQEKPVAIYDVSVDKKIHYQKEAIEEGIKSMLALPIVAKGKVLGVLRLLTGEPRKFSQQEIDFAVSLAEQCGTALENASMYEKVKKDYDDIMRYLEGAVWEKD
jgi:PAS domain S-box-containing protein